ncbi:MAG TPA: hypothetical protein VFN26_18425 [Candidatus Acidoferrum sp.]|nr:hypothetical protein [Candidatus Acidoferrum sp.]
MRLPKIGLKETKSFFEEYFYACLVALLLVVTILLKAGGMSTYSASVLGLWVTGFAWFARQAKLYFDEKSKPELKKKAAQPASTQPQNGKAQLPAAMKPMIGPQWPLKSPQPNPLPQPSQRSTAPGNKKKPAFVYERPTLPDRKPKFPANWAGAPEKKPKR